MKETLVWCNMYISIIMYDRTVKTEIRKLCEKTAAVSCCVHTFLINIRVNGDSAEMETIDHLRSCHLIDWKMIAD